MNFFAHALPYLDDPYFIAGTAAPDWLSVADRPVRIRQRFIDRFLAEDSTGELDENPQAVAFARGAAQHLKDDDWFHRQPAFVELSLELALLFRKAIGPDDNFRAGFLGHIVTEMLLDRILIEQQPHLLQHYYDQLEQLDFHLVQSTVERIATRPTEKLAPLIPRFIEEAFLADYLETEKLLFRLNQVMRRVKLPLLSDDFCIALEEGLVMVRPCQSDLLPSPVLAMLEETTS